MPDETAKLLVVVDSIYRAALEPEFWPVALEQISQLLSSGSSGLFVLNRETGSFPIAASDPRSPAGPIAAYGRDFADRDDLRQFARRQPVCDVLDTDAFPRELLRKSACFHDFYKRWDLGQFVGSLVMSDGLLEASLVVYRGDNSGAYRDDEIEIVHKLIPHVCRALEIWKKLERSGVLLDAVSQAPGTDGSGVALLDRDGSVVWLNHVAEAIVGRRDGVRIVRRQLLVDDPSAAAAIRTFCAHAAIAGGKPIGALQTAIKRPSGLQPLHLLARQIGRREQTAYTCPAPVVLIIREPEVTDQGSRQRLAGRLGLTAAEAELAEAFASGATLQDFATQRHISKETARTHLKRVMHKTGTRRQAELMHFLLTRDARV